MPYRGLYEFGYLARATTRGTFVVPPATVEAMYDPKFFARSEMAQTVVK
ncbi:MAG: hypothetical protein KC609_15450 [Myxococcales bacterium]|nr:hypothetical protein [Myxococcales bacterium]